MEADVDVFTVHVVLVVLRERNSRLVVVEQSGGVEGGPEDLGDECMQPERFLRGMRSRDVLGLSGGKRHNLLAFSTPQNGDTLASVLRANKSDKETKQNKNKQKRIYERSTQELDKRVRGLRGCSYTASSQPGTAGNERT